MILPKGSFNMIKDTSDYYEMAINNSGVCRISRKNSPFNSKSKRQDENCHTKLNYSMNAFDEKASGPRREFVKNVCYDPLKYTKLSKAHYWHNILNT